MLIVQIYLLGVCTISSTVISDIFLFVSKPLGPATYSLLELSKTVSNTSAKMISVKLIILFIYSNKIVLECDLLAPGTHKNKLDIGKSRNFFILIFSELYMVPYKLNT